MKSKVRKSGKRKTLKRVSKKAATKKRTKRQNKSLNYKNKNTRKNKKGGDAASVAVPIAAAAVIAGLAYKSQKNNTKPPTETKKYRWTTTNKSTNIPNNNPTNKSTNIPNNNPTNNAPSIPGSGSQQIDNKQKEEKETLAVMISFLEEELKDPIIEGASEEDPGMLEIIKKYELHKNKNNNDKLWKAIQEHITKHLENKNLTPLDLDKMINEKINLSKVKSSE